ncbi:MAG TPA: 50S ribosomal protein L23 [Cytophagales bacterium]|nr:50S ribosomal protein L23 [Cytophagales bacterium]
MSVLKKPLVTEKVSALNEKGKYGFLVDLKANKVEIKREVERMYGVSVLSIQTMRYMGKRKSRYTKAGVLSGKKNNFKKAIVSLREGEVIDFYSGI